MRIDDGFGHWLAGLIDGEGCFTITPNRPGFLCRMTLSLRADDAPTLEMICATTGLGRVPPLRRSPSMREGNRRPQAMWRVGTKADCQALVALLDRYPLRAKKARDFAIWREAVLIMAAMPPPVSGGRYGVRALDWDRIAGLKADLERARAYREPDSPLLLIGGVEARPTRAA